MIKNIDLYTTNDEVKRMIEDYETNKKIKEKMEKHFNFEIPDYIADDVRLGENYEHFCLMVNIAVINERLTEENANKLKNEVKKYFNIGYPHYFIIK